MLTVDLNKMKTLRKNNGFTLMEMSTALGYESPNGYHYLEHGRNQIKANQLTIIADKLGVQVQDLYKFDSSVEC